MKNTKIILLLALIGMFAVSAKSEQLLGSLIAVNNATSNSAPASIGSITVPSQVLDVQTTGIPGGTNGLSVITSVSLDGTNFVSLHTLKMSTTNATTQAFNTGSTNVTLYFRVSAVTTTNVTLGITRQ